MLLKQCIVHTPEVQINASTLNNNVVLLLLLKKQLSITVAWCFY